MKLVRFNGGRLGIIKGNAVIDLTDELGLDIAEWPPLGMVRLIADYAKTEAIFLNARENERTVPLEQVRLETPIPWPNKLIAIPVNYTAHAIEMSSPAISRNAGFFIKSASSLSGAGEPIVLPDLPGRAVHHEAELAVIIGRQCRHVPREHALAQVFGYSCLLDITVRGKQERAMRKSFDSFTPMGPWIITADEIGEPSDLDLKLWVNDELRQNANTRDMIIDVPEIIAMTSAVMTLYPGDVIATGTCEGVGPIVEGDTVTIEITRVGRMAVRVIQGKGGCSIAMPYEKS